MTHHGKDGVLPEVESLASFDPLPLAEYTAYLPYEMFSSNKYH